MSSLNSSGTLSVPSVVSVLNTVGSMNNVVYNDLDKKVKKYVICICSHPLSIRLVFLDTSRNPINL